MPPLVYVCIALGTIYTCSGVLSEISVCFGSPKMTLGVLVVP